MRRFLPLLCILIALSAAGIDCGGDASATTAAPKPKAVSLKTRIAVVCPATGPCQLIATWALPGSWRAGTDSLGVVWSQATPTTVANLRTKYTRGTADTLQLPRTAAEGVAYGGGLAVTTYRQGTNAIAGPARAAWTAPALPVAAPDSVTILKVSLITVDGSLSYAQAGLYNYATYAGGDLTSCAVGSEVLDALGRMTLGNCRLTTGAAYTAVHCVVVERATDTRWAFPSNTVSDCLVKASPLAAAKYGAAWHPTRAPYDSIAFTMLPPRTSGPQVIEQTVASLK